MTSIPLCGILKLKETYITKKDGNNMTIKEIRVQMKLSQSKFAEYFNVPLRTVQHWEQESRKPPVYVITMMQRILALETENAMLKEQ